MKDHYFDIWYCTKMGNVEKYNVWYLSWFLREIEIILMNKWGKFIKTGENFIKMCFTEDYVQNIV